MISLPWSYWTSVPPAILKGGLEVFAVWIWDMQSNWCKSILAWAHARGNQTGIFLGVLMEHFLTPDHAHPNPLLSDGPSSYFCGPEDSFGGMLHLYSMPPWRFCLFPFTTDLHMGCQCPVYVYLSLGIWCPGLMDWLLAWFMATDLNPRVGYLCLSACYISQRVTVGLSSFIERVWLL